MSEWEPTCADAVATTRQVIFSTIIKCSNGRTIYADNFEGLANKLVEALQDTRTSWALPMLAIPKEKRT
jgi:hypothetical protein